MVIPSIPLVGLLPRIVFVSLLLAVLCGVFWSRRRWPSLAIAAVVTAVAFVVWNLWLVPFNSPLEPQVYLGVFALVAALAAPRRRLLAIVALVATVGLINDSYEQYPTTRALHPEPVAVSLTAEQFAAQTTVPLLDDAPVGALVTFDVPASGEFVGRPAIAYVPPAYWSGARLPVVVLLAGNPGSPGQWFSVHNADATADALQRVNDGVSPIIVSADGTGSTTGNPMCTKPVRHYLTRDVPAAIRNLMRVDEDLHHWTIGGLSYGGTCSLQVVTNEPDTYGTFLNFSGEAEPSYNGSHQESIDRFYNGDEAAYQAENPATILRSAHFPQLAGRFIAGERDEESLTALSHLNELAQAAGIDSSFMTLPGGHTAQVWRRALRETLVFAGERGGLTLSAPGDVV